jgi:predicted nucleic acid-binding protein
MKGASGADVDLLDEALEAKQAVLPPVVLTELLSDPHLAEDVASLFKCLPGLELLEGYWERAGASRQAVLAKGHKARVADALIAQSCLDHKLGLLTRDQDFKNFSRICGLVLVQ